MEQTSRKKGSALRSGASVALMLGCLATARAQILHAPHNPPTFAVASVHPSSPNEIFDSHAVRADNFTGRAMTARQLISFAYGISFDDEISGGPAWIRTERFDIDARPDDSEVIVLSKQSKDDVDEQIRLMLQSLLKERFGLAVSFTSKNMPGYELVIAKSGLKCKPVEPIYDLARMPAPRFHWTSLPAPPPPPPGWVPPSPDQKQVLAQSMHLDTKYMPFWLVVTALSHEPEVGGRVVVDKTGVQGNYDCEATWSRAGSDGAGPAYFTAIEDQMGLKLKPQKVRTEVLVIDSIRRPSEN